MMLHKQNNQGLKMSEYSFEDASAGATIDNTSLENSYQDEASTQFQASVGQLPQEISNPVEEVQRFLQEKAGKTNRFLQEKTKDVNWADVGRTVAIAGVAGLTVAAAAPFIAGAGLVGATAIAGSMVLGAATGFTAGKVIDLGDAVSAETIGTKRLFEGSENKIFERSGSDALLGGSTGLNIGAMNAFHPTLEAIPAKVLGQELAKTGVGKAFDLGAHTIGHIALDSTIESGRQVAQGISEGKSPTQIGKDWKLAITATAPASVASTLAVEFMESKIKGSRPFLMSLAEGGEAATRGGAVKGLQMAGNTINKGNEARTPTKVAAMKPQAVDKTHTVAEGEILEEIAEKELGKRSYVSHIIASNRLPNPDLIFSGQKLIIPNLKPEPQEIASR
jgi:hypothetical protein